MDKEREENFKKMQLRKKALQKIKSELEEKINNLENDPKVIEYLDAKNLLLETQTTLQPIERMERNILQSSCGHEIWVITETRSDCDSLEGQWYEHTFKCIGCGLTYKNTTSDYLPGNPYILQIHEKWLEAKKDIPVVTPATACYCDIKEDYELLVEKGYSKEEIYNAIISKYENEPNKLNSREDHAQKLIFRKSEQKK